MNYLFFHRKEEKERTPYLNPLREILITLVEVDYNFLPTDTKKGTDLINVDLRQVTGVSETPR